MKTKSLLCIIGAIVCLTSIPVHANWMAVQSSGSLFSGGPHSVGTTDGSTIDLISPAVTFGAWKDQAATQSCGLSTWWWLLGVNSGTGNGALIDNTESMTLQLGPSWDVNQLRFIYNTANTIISVSGFLSDPIATPQVYNSPDIGTISYSGGTLLIPITAGDTGGNMAMVNFANADATLGATLEITVSAGGATALNQITYSQVPEPASLSLLGLGATLLLGLRRKN